MKAITREEARVEIEGDGVELRRKEIGGDMTTAFVRLPAGADLGPRWSDSRTTSASVRTGDIC